MQMYFYGLIYNIYSISAKAKLNVYLHTNHITLWAYTDSAVSQLKHKTSHFCNAAISRGLLLITVLCVPTQVLWVVFSRLPHFGVCVSRWEQPSSGWKTNSRSNISLVLKQLANDPRTLNIYSLNGQNTQQKHKIWSHIKLSCYCKLAVKYAYLSERGINI